MIRIQRDSIIRYLVIIFAALGIYSLGITIGTTGLNFQFIIIVLALGAGFITIVLPRGVEWGYLIWIGMFALGYRTTRLFTYVSLHPLTVEIFLLASVILLKQSSNKEKQVPIQWGVHSVGVIVFLFWWVWGWIPGFGNGVEWAQMLQSAHNAFLVIPIFFVTWKLIQTEKIWKRVLSVLFFTSALMSLLGLLEYTVPNFSSFIPINGYLLSDNLIFSADQNDFLRATFTYWGAALAGYVIALGLPCFIVLFQQSQKNWVRLLLFAGFVLDIIGVYISGYRSLWFAVLIAGVFFMFHFGAKGIIWGIVISIIFLIILPQSAQQRFGTLVSAVEGDIEDSSSAKRVDRINESVALVTANPFGYGWSDGGWIHNDFLQIAVDIGLIPGILYVLWYIFTFVNAYLIYLRGGRDMTLFTLLAIFIIAGGMILNQGPQAHTQLMAPVWFSWALVDLRARQLSSKQELKSL